MPNCRRLLGTRKGGYISELYKNICSIVGLDISKIIGKRCFAFWIWKDNEYFFFPFLYRGIFLKFIDQIYRNSFIKIY